MKALKPFFTFLIFVVISAVILSLVTPASQKVEKTITINAPAAIVYEQLSRLEHFNQWSVWSRQDSAVQFSFSGTDGTVGASAAWKGDPALSGEGRIVIKSLEPGHKVVQTLQFSKPRKGKGESVFTVTEKNGLTTVAWKFEMATPRPWNIFNLFYSMDKEMGSDFEKGLFALKEITEKQAGTAPQKQFDVMTMDFPATSFAIIRQEVKWTDITSFFGQHIRILYEEAGKNKVNAGAATGLYYVWDEKNQQTDMAAAVPVPAGTRIQNNIIRIDNINGSKAVYVNYPGAYDKIADAHNSLDRYIADKKLTQKFPVIEQYISGPFNEKDTAKWLTKVVYLVE